MEEGYLRNGNLEKGYPVPQRWIGRECYPECELPRVNAIRGRSVSQGVWNNC